jgi:hypothetical protein
MDWEKVIFLAHAKEDKPFVIEFYHELKREGFEPWLDEFSLQPGDKWELKIKEAILKSRIFIACISKNTNRDGYWCKEVRQVLSIMSERHPDATKPIPCLIDDVEIPIFEVDTVSLADFHKAILYTEEGKKRLFESLRSKLKIQVPIKLDIPVPINNSKMPIEATIIGTRSKEGQELNQMIYDLLRSMGMRVTCNESPDQSQFLRACIGQDLVIADATVEANGLHNYAAFTAQPISLDHILIVSRTYLPQNFYGMREGGAPIYPHSRTNREIIEWLKLELNDLMPALPRPSWKKNMLITGMISPFQDLTKEQERARNRHQVFISYRNKEAESENFLNLKQSIKRGDYHNGVSQGVRIFEPGELAYQDEILSPLQRWGILSAIEEKMRTIRECWIFESGDYYDSWWTCGEMVLMAYFQAVSKIRPVLKVYNQKEGKVRIEPNGIIPELTYEQRRNIDRLLSGSGRSRGAETAQKMRELSELPVIGSHVLFSHPVFSKEWFQLRLFEGYESNAAGWENNLDVDDFMAMSHPQPILIPNSILEETVRRGQLQYEYKRNIYEIKVDKPRYDWYATRMGEPKGFGNELTIVTQPVFRVKNVSN